MSVKNTHKDYDRMSGKWKRCRDVAAGQDAMRAQCSAEGFKRSASSYIPVLHEQSIEEYMKYVNRAPFYNAAWRTIEGLNGMLFRKDPVVEAQQSVLDLLTDTGLNGVPFDMLAQQVGEEALKVGRVGLLVDYPQATEGATLADAQRLNLRPTIAVYLAEAIINWKMEHVNNVYSLTQVVLTEEHEEAKDEFTTVCETRYRVLDLLNGKYRQRVFRINKNTDLDEQIGPDIFPTMGSIALDYIPFTFISVDDITCEVDDPPLIDLVDMNIAHWRTTADYEHGCHFAGLPTAVVTGYRPDENGTKLFIGSATAWIFPDPNAKASYLEFTGAGLTPLKENMSDKEMRMAVLGARMLEPMKRGVEAADTAQIHRSGEQASMAKISMSISLGLTEVLKTFSAWAGVADDKAVVKVNKDFYPIPMDAQTLTGLVTSWQQGAISSETLFANLQRAEIISSDRTLEEEQASIINDPLRMPPAPPTDPNAQGGAGA